MFDTYPFLLQHLVPFLGEHEIQQWPLINVRCKRTSYLVLRFFAGLDDAGIWKRGWMKVMSYIHRVHPTELRTMSNYNLCMYRMMKVLKPYLSDHISICGSFALYVAERKLHRRPTWTPGDIDLFLTTMNSLHTTTDILIDLVHAGCRVDVVQRREDVSMKSIGENYLQADRERLVVNTNSALAMVYAHGNSKPYSQRCRHQVYRYIQSVVSHPPDSNYQFHLMDVRVDGEVNLSFILAEIHNGIPSVLNSFDLSICKVAIQTDYNGELMVCMKPWVKEHLLKKICTGMRNTQHQDDTKLKQRISKYAARGYRFVGQRCVCNRECNGNLDQCNCYGFIGNTERGACESSECCKQLLCRPYDQRYYAYQPPKGSLATRKACGHWCDLWNEMECCQCMDRRTDAEAYVSTLDTVDCYWMGRSWDYCRSCKWG